MTELKSIDLATLDNVTGGATEAELRSNLAGCYEWADQAAVGSDYKHAQCTSEFVRQNFRNFGSTPTPTPAPKR